ncbi:MAG TPA: DNA translocase FtsK 4TM domain-containing protein [Micavibrio sp.]
MARYSATVRNKRKKQSTPFLPENMQAFMARRMVDGVALALALIGFALVLALLSYDHTDPSWNTARTNDFSGIQNLMGLPGAYLADVLLQTIGLGALAFGISLMAWGLRMWRRDVIGPVWARVAALMFASICLAAATARIPAGAWLLSPWMGGSGGVMILNGLSDVLMPLLGSSVHMVAASMAAAVGLVALSYACAVTRAEIFGFMGWVWQMIGVGFAFAAAQISAFRDWISHYNDADYRPAKQSLRKPAPRPKRAPKVVADEDEEEEVAEDEEEEDSDEEDIEEEDEEEESRSLLRARKAKVVAAKKQPKAKGKTRQLTLSLDNDGEWELPTLDLLTEPPANDSRAEADQPALRKNADMLQNVLNDFNVEGEIVSIHPGPVVTLYELEPAPGVKTSRVIGLSDDIARSMAAISVRSAVIPGRNVIGIELPNQRRQTVWLRQLLETDEVIETKAHLPLVLGKDIGGGPVIADLARMPHLLVAGTTGSGKSVAINTMILSLLYRLPPEKCRFIMIDPKMIELSVYDDIPHLLSPVVTEPGKAVVALKWVVNEMEERYRAMSKLGVRNIEGYNVRLAEARKKGETLMRKVQTGFDGETGKPVYEDQPMDMTELPFIVVIVDEFADLMLVAGKDVENAVQRIAQKARAAGIHLIMATQRPSVDVITGVIKANFPTRISFQVTSKIDSRTILGEAGAEQLLGMGDMLYMASGGRVSRVHGPFVSDAEVESVVTFLKKQGQPAYIDDITEGGFGGENEVMNALFGGEGGDGSDVDELWDEAVAVVAKHKKASTSFIQRCLNIGYNRAARIIEEMERQGIVGPANHVGKREVLVSDFSDA